MTAHELTLAREQAKQFLAPSIACTLPQRDLPYGVMHSGSSVSPYVAQIRRQGRTIHGGYHGTIDLASARVAELVRANPKRKGREG